MEQGRVGLDLLLQSWPRGEVPGPVLITLGVVREEVFVVYGPSHVLFLDCIQISRWC